MTYDALPLFLTSSAIWIFFLSLCLVALAKRPLFDAIVRAVIDVHAAFVAGFFVLLVAIGFWWLFLKDNHPLVLMCLGMFPAVTCMVAVFVARPSKHFFTGAKA